MSLVLLSYLQDPTPIPQTGDSLLLPPSATLEYWDDILEVVQGRRVVRRIENIQRLFFWTGFNGTRVFIGSARVPDDEIFGGGVCVCVCVCV